MPGPRVGSSHLWGLPPPPAAPLFFAPNIQGPQHPSLQAPAILCSASWGFHGATTSWGSRSLELPAFPLPWGPKCLDSWEGSKGMWADGPEAGRPPSPQLPADRAPLWGLNTVSNLPPPPTHCGPLRRGARAALGRRRPGRPDALTAPSAPPPALGSDTGHYPLSTVPQSCSCSQAAGPPCRSPAGPLSTSPVYPDSAGPEEEALAPAHTPKPCTGRGVGGSLQGGRTIFLAEAALPAPSPHSRGRS